MSERWLFVRWQSVFVKQPSNDNVAWWVWYVLLRNMPWWWVVAVTTFYICGWTTVVGVVWSCYEWSCLSYLVQCCCQTISVYYWFGSAWRWYCIDLCRHGCMRWWVVTSRWYWGCCNVLFLRDVGDVVAHEVDCAVTSRWWYGRMFVAMSSYLMMWSDVVVDGIVLMCRHSGGMRWCVAVVVEVGVCAALPSWWFMMMLIHGVDCCDCWSIYLQTKGKFNYRRIKFCW